MYRVKRIPQVIAHRGFSGAYPENTRPALLGAIAVGADMVEIDVRLARDGVPVVYHDAAIGGHANLGPRIEDLFAGEIRELDLGRYRGERFRKVSILTLDEALALVQDRIPINLDIKTPHALLPAIRQVQARAMVEQAVFSGCTGMHAKRARTVEPHLHVLMNVDDHMRTLLRLCSTRLALLLSWLQAHRVQASGLNIGHHIAANSFIRGAAARNLPVWTWTVDNPQRARELVNLGAVSITTNWPDRILAEFPCR